VKTPEDTDGSSDLTHHGKPYALIQPLEEADLEELEWRQLARRKLARAWEDDTDALYDDL
jgi:hypothetical protein